MTWNVINKGNGYKGKATFKDNEIVVVTNSPNDRVYPQVIHYENTATFAINWRFIEKQPLLNPKVIDFIKNFLELNGIFSDDVESIAFQHLKYNDEEGSYTNVTLSIKPYNPCNEFNLAEGVIDYNLIDDNREYTLQELGIVI